MRSKYKDAIYQMMQEYSRTIAVLVDSGTEEYDLVRRDMPERVIECGISEANAIGVAAGLASCGYIPIVYGMGAFLAYRAFEFIRNDVCVQNRNVKIVGSGGGIGYNNLGPTHHTTEDIAVMTALPNMCVLAPATPLEVEPILKQAIDYYGPVYIRFGKAYEEEVYTKPPSFEIGKAAILSEGEDVSIFVTGSLLADVVKSVEILSKDNISAQIINMTSLKPIDRQAIIQAAQKTGRVLVVEEHNYFGGLRSLVADVLTEEGMSVIFQSIGFKDEYCFEYGWRQEIRKKYNISVEGIVNKVREMCHE
ncbi:MAG: transketolase [Butyrivibrio sp.]|nr:transketolase [Butyrivibrio sp.]